MKWMTKALCITCLGILLAGCGDRLHEIKDAAAGITSAADSAADAVSPDVHSIRAMTISYKNETFTINDLFKTILRDVRWEYDVEQGKLRVMGTWQAPLFSEQAWDHTLQKQLAEVGQVTVICMISDDQIDDSLTNITLVLNKETLLQMNGEEALYHLYDTYLAK